MPRDHLQRTRRGPQAVFNAEFVAEGVVGLQVMADVADEDAGGEDGVAGNVDIVKALQACHLKVAQQIFKHVIMGYVVLPPIPKDLAETETRKLLREYKTLAAIDVIFL